MYNIMTEVMYETSQKIMHCAACMCVCLYACSMHECVCVCAAAHPYVYEQEKNALLFVGRPPQYARKPKEFPYYPFVLVCCKLAVCGCMRASEQTKRLSERRWATSETKKIKKKEASKYLLYGLEHQLQQQQQQLNIYI